jgi:hypothetical protein
MSPLELVRQQKREEELVTQLLSEWGASKEVGGPGFVLRVEAPSHLLCGQDPAE